MGAPQLVVAVPAMMFMLPGLMVFRGMYQIAIENPETTMVMSMMSGLAELFNAMIIILAIAPASCSATSPCGRSPPACSPTSVREPATAEISQRSLQSMGSAPSRRSASLAWEKGLDPKKPRLAESGEGCGW